MDNPAVSCNFNAITKFSSVLKVSRSVKELKVYSIPSNTLSMSETQAIFQQPRAYNESTNVHPLTPLQSVTSLKIRHDRSAECCSSTSHYELVDPSQQIIFTGIYCQNTDCCSSQRSPVLLQDCQRRAVMQVGFGHSDDCCGGGDINVTIDSPPGSTIGKICIERNFLSRTQYTIESSLNGQRLNVRRDGHFFTGPDYYLTTHDSRTVGIVKKRGKFSVEVSKELDPTMKANVIGFAIVLDVFHEEEERRRSQQTSTNSTTGS